MVNHHKIEYKKGMFDYYKNDTNPDHWIDWFEGCGWEIPFADIMWGLGFEMDCYESYYEKFERMDDSKLSETEKQDMILSNLSKSDIKLVGNYIFSRFRELTHWSDYGYEIEKASYFFPKAFEILEDKFEKLQGNK